MPVSAGGRAKLDAHVASAPVAHPFDRGRGGYRSLISCSVHPEVPVIRDKLKRKFLAVGPAVLGRRGRTCRNDYLRLPLKGLAGCAAARDRPRPGLAAVRFTSCKIDVGDVQAADRTKPPAC